MKEKRHEGKPGPYCGRCPYKDQPYVPGDGPDNASVMVLGEGPGMTDARTGRCFSGITGKRLTKQLSYAKLFLSDCWAGNVVMCHVPKSRKPTKTAIRCCRPLLEEEMAKVQPSTVITLGAASFEAFYDGKLAAYHGSKIAGEGYTLVPMYKPDAYDDNPDLLRTIYNDYRGLKDRRQLTPASGDYRLSRAWVKPGNDRYSIDTETTGLDLRSKLLGMSISDSPGEASYIPAMSCPKWTPFMDHTVMHNAKYDLGILESNEVCFIDEWEDVDDTYLLAYCMNKKPLGLKALAIQELQTEMLKYTDVADGDKSLAGVPDEEVAEYASADADMTLRLWEHLWKTSAPWERTLYETIEKPLPGIMAKAQLAGVVVDVDHFEKMSVDMGIELQEWEIYFDSNYGLAPEVLRSPTALAKWLTFRLKRHVHSTEKYALEKLQNLDPIVKDLLEWRPRYKLKTAFVDSILNLQRAGLVFPEFNQTGTGTGRVSCKKPNLQQLPKRGDKTIRKGFTAPPGHVVASLDNSQIDLRSLAYLSQDEEMNRVFREDLDMHDETAMDIIGNVEELSRRLAKTANFLTVFGGGAAALAMKTGVEEDIAYDFMDRYWDRHPGVKNWVEDTHQKLMDLGYVETVYKRRRYIPKVYTRERGAALREGQNMPVQGTSADVLKLQQAAVADIAIPFGQIHDELDFYLPEEHAVEMCRELKARMEGVDCPFKLKVECAVGPNMGEMEKVAF